MYLLKDTSNIIAIVSTIFSGISIIVTVLSMTMERSLMRQQEFTVIKMDVTGPAVTANAARCKKRVKKIIKGISAICGLDHALIEMVRPRRIPKGLRLECYLYVTNTESTELGYVKLFEEAKSNKTLVRFIREAWKLEAGSVNISNLKVEEMKSVQETKRLMSEGIQMGEKTPPLSASMETRNSIVLEYNTDTEISPNNLAKPQNVWRGSIRSDRELARDATGEDEQEKLEGMSKRV